MPGSDVEVAVIGGGAAGVAAGRRLRAAGVDLLIVEARKRLGGRAWTDVASGYPLDLGCGWLHSADRNPWVAVAEEEGFSIDKSPPPWARGAMTVGFSKEEQKSYREALDKFYERAGAMAKKERDAAASAALEPGGRWNNMIDAVYTYISGAETDRVSLRDSDNYRDSGVNWRVTEGYGAAIAKAGAALPIAYGNPVTRIDHSGKKLKIETAQGAITADRAIVTLPTAILAERDDLFLPALPDKTEAARGLPLGLADKLFLSLDRAEEFEAESRLYGQVDRVATATYHLRPFGRPIIEVYFGGLNAAALEKEGERAFFDFAARQLSGLLGSAFASRIKPLRMHRWQHDPFARGSYSYAKPGKAECRGLLAAPVAGRLFFAGEACSKQDFSTAHGGYHTGVAAADAAIAARKG